MGVRLVPQRAWEHFDGTTHRIEWRDEPPHQPQRGAADVKHYVLENVPFDRTKVSEFDSDVEAADYINTRLTEDSDCHPEHFRVICGNEVKMSPVQKVIRVELKP